MTEVHYQGNLQLNYDHPRGHFDYMMVCYSYPNIHEPQTIPVEAGDQIVVRDPDGLIVLKRTVQYDFDSYRQMNHDTGTMYQFVNRMAVNGVLQGTDGPLWVNLFLGNYKAELVKNV